MACWVWKSNALGMRWISKPNKPSRFITSGTQAGTIPRSSPQIMHVGGAFQRGSFCSASLFQQSSCCRKNNPRQSPQPRSGILIQLPKGRRLLHAQPKMKLSALASRRLDQQQVADQIKQPLLDGIARASFSFSAKCLSTSRCVANSGLSEYNCIPRKAGLKNLRFTLSASSPKV